MTTGESDAQGRGKEQASTIQGKNIQGLKYFDMLLPLLEQLLGEKCGRRSKKGTGVFSGKLSLNQ
ncbi:hypothetical protein RISK_000042 [Rhodopirellula islandica]|uniref:Uncharacterized protein n=1 Tax=Rhodopirellula islandica TaxID=595434 RepID=A0A0J1BN13_RHOIS|nr:hypothetical protein RISK_000042 [Rhodopirellula islandica]